MKEYRINTELRNQSIQIVGQEENYPVLSFGAAYKIAQSKYLDLVEVNQNGNTSICKLMDYNKFIYEQKKKEKENKAKSNKIETKELRVNPNIDKHDFETKLDHAKKFIEAGNKVRLTMLFAGRSIIYKDKGLETLNSFVSELSELAQPESEIKSEGRKFMITLVPKKK